MGSVWDWRGKDCGWAEDGKIWEEKLERLAL
jgi:hypothetical protein